MASTTVVKVRVQELSKYGFKANDRYVGYSKLFKDQARVVPGAEFEAEFYIADSGKEYLNKIVAMSRDTVKAAEEVKAVPPTAVSTMPGVDAARAKHFTPKFQKKEDGAASSSTSMSKAEWQAKDRSQLIGGLSHDAAAITAAMCSVDTKLSPLVFYKELLLGMLAIRDEVK